jgi:hypothetical protein
MTEIKIAVVPTNEAEMAGGIRQLANFADRAEVIGDALNSIAASLRDRLQTLAQEPGGGWNVEEVTLAFSLEVQGQTGIIMASASATAGMQASMTWKRSPQHP